MSSKPFFEKYLGEEATAEDIDDFIDAWHENSGGMEIFEYLGMTKDEYALWLRDPDALPQIARARGRTVSQRLKGGGLRS